MRRGSAAWTVRRRGLLGRLDGAARPAEASFHIRLGAIDVVVVYKVDRLTRALMDFAKIVEVFDRHGVSFVSVTQAFNTTTSMGRLTLNVLLSFAQFEREVTGERIRDKIAASKQKGMWIGGLCPARLRQEGPLPRDRRERGRGRSQPLPPLSRARNGPGLTEPGDLWLLGEHKILCGDTRDRGSFIALMGDERARLVFSDPPYNVKVDGHVCGLGSVKHAEFAFASGEMSEDEFVAFLTAAFRNQAEFSMDGAIHFHCIDWRHMGEMLKAGHSVYSELKNLCVWAKDNGGMGSFYRSQHELVFVWKVGTGPHVNTVELGRYGRYRTNVWPYAGVNTLKKGRMSELAMHPTVKPVAMIMDAIKDCSKAREIVLDGFGGSGSTLIAAEKTKRKARLIEYEPRYVDVTVKRWEALTGKKATHASSGKTFAQTAAEQCGKLDDEALADAALA
jgi:DNA modification methylase